MGERLFSPTPLSKVIEGKKEQLRQAVNEHDANAFMGTSDEELRRHFIDTFKAEPLELLEDQLGREKPKEVDVDVRNDRFRDPFDPPTVRGAQYTIVVPFSGDAGLFGCYPSNQTTYKPNGTVRGNELRLSYTRTDHDAAALKQQIEQDLGSIRQYVDSINHELADYNKELPGRVNDLISWRRNKIINCRETLGVRHGSGIV